MKAYVSLIVLCVLFTVSSSGLFAGSVEQNTNQSAEYMKTLNRNASTDADATFYNPAGTAFMDGGAYIYLSAQTIIIPIAIYGHSLTRSVYRGDKTSYCMPDLHVVYNKHKAGGGSGNLAWSLGIMAIGGGGSGEYKHGLSYIDNTLFLLKDTLNSLYASLGIPYTLGSVMTSSFKGSSAYYSGMTSLAYSFLDDRLAVSLGYRFIYGNAYYDAKLYSNGIVMPLGGSFHARQDGTAHGVIVGISAKPVDSVTIGFKFEYNSPLDMKTKASGYYIVGLVDPSLMNGGVAHRQLPMNANIGVAYRIQGVQLSCSFNYYANHLAKWNGKERSFRDGFEAGLGMDYTFGAVPLNIGCGYMFTTAGTRPSGQSQIAEMPDGHTMGTGLTYTFDKKIKLTCAFGLIYWMPVDVNKGTPLRFLRAYFHKIGYDIALGAEFKII